MKPLKSKLFWLARNKLQIDSSIVLTVAETQFAEYGTVRNAKEIFCTKGFAAITGLHLKKGESRQFQLIEVVAPVLRKAKPKRKAAKR